VEVFKASLQSAVCNGFGSNYTQIESGASVLMDVAAMQQNADNMRKELLELISSISDGTNSERASSVGCFTCA
jgi:hypothetical protein